VEVYRALMDIADDRKVITDNDILAVVSGVRTAKPAASGPVDPFDTPSAGGHPALHESGYGHGV
jgi:hypothetical protein